MVLLQAFLFRSVELIWVGCGIVENYRKVIRQLDAEVYKNLILHNLSLQ